MGKKSFKGKSFKNNNRKNYNKEKNEDFEESSNYDDVVIDARKLLGKAEDEEFQFEDEELDSDEAWGDSDYEVLDNKFSQTTRDNRKKGLEEEYDEEDWDSAEEGQLISLSEAWDRDDREIKEIAQETKSGKGKRNDLVLDEDDSISSESEESSEDEDEDQSKSQSESDDDPFDEMNISDEETNLGSVMAKLQKPKSKSKEKKQLINDKSSESAFALPTAGDSLTFDDMLMDINSDDETTTTLLKSEKQKHDSDSEDDETITRNYHGEAESNDSGAFAVPLPISIQKKQERRAAYEIQKDQVNRWKDVVRENREKEVLNFTPAQIKESRTSAFAPSDKPVTSLEEKLDSILQQSGLEEKKTEDLFENIETAKLSKEEMMKKTKELRMMRELMYRGERDNKRLKKIKSKAYRKQLRKEKDKERRLAMDAEGIDEEDEEDPEYKRAMERMTLRHKNTSSWAKTMIKSGISKDKDSREEMEEMMRQADSLKLKQLGKDGEESEDERDLSDVEKNIIDDESDDENTSKLGKGVLAMDFMKNAAKKEKMDRLQQIEELRRLREGGSELDKELFKTDSDGVNSSANSGRRVYTPSALVASEEAKKIDREILEEQEIDESNSLENRLEKAVEKKRVVESFEEEENHNSLKAQEEEAQEEEEANPWLMEDDEEENSKASKKSSNVSIVDKDSSRNDKFTNKLNKAAEREERKLKKTRKTKEEEVIIDTNQTLKLVDPKIESEKKRAAAASDDELEAEAQHDDDVHMFKQSDLISQAFAGDDVIQQEFHSEKRAIEEDEGDKEVVDTLPGWGDWAGGDDAWQAKRKKRKVVRIVQGVTNKNKRLDKGKDKVIINEKINKANLKYKADRIPHPFKTWDEYEKSLRMPLGQEWTSQKTFRKTTTPKVITKFGTVIDPLKAPFKE
ncbi:Utp14 protein [Martiniozyma asiatica (nom. inval.)]|nr:Utp14 protein [Martiniozyma asiatica]